MRLTLDLSPELEAKLRQLAKASGKDPHTLAAEILQSKLADLPKPKKSHSKELRLLRFRKHIASVPDGNPNADLSRKAAYRDCG